MSELFPGAPDPKRRRSPNVNASVKDDDHLVIRWVLSPTERRTLHWNEPGPSGDMGGYQQFENALITMIDQHEKTTERDKVLDIDKDTAWRLMRYIQGYGTGGPNDRLRKAFRRFIGVGH